MTHHQRPVPTDPLDQDRSSPRGLLEWVATHARRLEPASRLGRVLLIGPALVAVLLLALFVFLAGGVSDGETPVSAWVWLETTAYWLLALLYNVLPSLALAGLLSMASRLVARGMPALAVGTVVFTAFNLYALIPMFVDDSSTGVLLFLFLPLYTGTFVLLTACAAWLVHVLRHPHGHPTDSLPPRAVR